MPRLIHRNPKYRKHRASGQAVVTLNGKDHYLGPWNTKASRQEYDRLIGEWLANSRRSLDTSANDRLIVELRDGFWTHAQTQYGGDGAHRGELGSYHLVLLKLKPYNDTPIADFGPRALKGVRQAMIESGWARTYINRQVGRLKHIFKWGVENELVPVTIYQTLLAVTGLRMGKSAARESEPVKPVPDAYVDGIHDFVSRQVWAMIELQRLTGMRPGEVCMMRGRDIDTTGKLWVYKPASHKTAHHGYERTVYLGPRAQQILGEFWKTDLSAYLFSPKEAEAERRGELHEARKTPLNEGNKPGSNRVRKAKRAPTDRYTTDSYRRAIDYACSQAFPLPDPLARGRMPRKGSAGSDATRRETVGEWKTRIGEKGWKEVLTWRREHRWHPHQLRHNAATRLRKQYGLEAAQVILGHESLDMTELYAEKNQAAAQRIMSEVG